MAARGCPEIGEALAAEQFWKHLPFARPPVVSIMSPDQVASIVDATHLLVDQQDVTPLGLARQAIELQSAEDPLRHGPPPRPARDEGLTMAAILYLDVDDEITTAAARIRGSADPKVALVVPPGSRIATSRMNFRLLAREALERNRGLSIVAADPAARAIAGSAGLPVYASVAEFEAAIAPPAPVAPPPPAVIGPTPGEDAGDEDETGPSSAVAAGLAGAAVAAAVTPGPVPETPTAPEAGSRAEAAPGPARGRRSRGAAREAATVEAAALEAAGSPDAQATEPIAPASGSGTSAGGSAVEPPPIEPPATGEPRARSRAAALPVVPAARSGRGVSRWVVAGVIALLLVVALAIAGFLVLPSATVVVTPSPVPVGPVELRRSRRSGRDDRRHGRGRGSGDPAEQGLHGHR